MKFLLATTCATLALAHASPTINTTSDIAARTNPGIYICSEPNWKGQCVWYEALPGAFGSCAWKIIPGGWGSVGVDKGISVTFYKDATCTGIELPGILMYPGLTNPAWDKKVEKRTVMIRRV